MKRFRVMAFMSENPDGQWVHVDDVEPLRRALARAVEAYGKPGGPWNVPNEPGSWLAEAKEALGLIGPVIDAGFAVDDDGGCNSCDHYIDAGGTGEKCCMAPPEIYRICPVAATGIHAKNPEQKGGN